jgi:pyruvate/2-oxoglutarate/acetoin dehydrogenase E1 component
VPLGRANTCARRSDLTIVTWSRGIEPCLQALDLDELQGCEGVDVIDLRTLWPWDQAAVF